MKGTLVSPIGGNLLTCGISFWITGPVVNRIRNMGFI